jgi:hypothetical protein
MHYKNGRIAKNGDKVVYFKEGQRGGAPCVGILYDAQSGRRYGGGKIAVTSPNDPCPNLSECLHVDDVYAKLGDLGIVPDASETGAT